MNPNDLPNVGPIINGHHGYLDKFSHLHSVKGENILVIGFSETEVGEFIDPFGYEHINLLTNWTGHLDAESQRYPLVMGDITTRTEFGDGVFDAVLTLSLFEHVSNLDDALGEVSRLLRPGGYLYASFGAAWSSPYGHHLYSAPEDPLQNFTSWKMPAYLHLLCSRDEISRYYLENGYSQETITQILHWFFETPIINRYMYDDYIANFTRHFQIVASETMYNHVPDATLDLLRKKFPRHNDFTTYGGSYLLQKSP